MKNILAFILAAVLLLQSCTSKSDNVSKSDTIFSWKAVHLLHYNNDTELKKLEYQIPKLAKMGINKIILEVDYHFNFKSHPELRQTNKPITIEGAKNFTKICNVHGIEIIPQFQSLGHQSWAGDTWKLLEVYPKLDLTPGAFPNNEGLYCREWDVTNPKVYEIVFALIDEICEAFDAKAIHVGMDEVFLLGWDESPNTKGQNPAELYAKAVNDLYSHIVKKRGLEMLMWGDRLIDAQKNNYGEWESSANGTAIAIDLIPKDIIICDWHYESIEAYKTEVKPEEFKWLEKGKNRKFDLLRGDKYLSIPMFLDNGFRVLPTSWKSVENMKSLVIQSSEQKNEKMLGHLFTLWSSAKGEELINYPPLIEGLKYIHKIDQK